MYNDVICNKIPPKFDGKYKVVLSFASTYRDMEKINWVNKNSRNLVDIQFLEDTAYIAFEDENDALLFEIKYM